MATTSVAAAEVALVIDEAFFDVEGGPYAAGDFAMVELDDVEMDLLRTRRF